MIRSAIGIDLGGTTLKGIIVDQDGNRRHITRIPTEADKGGPTILANIINLIDILLREEGDSSRVIGIGLGSPGFVDPDGTVLGGAENLAEWKGMQIFRPIHDKFGLETTAGNDVTVAALGEARFGAARGVANMVCLALGTGVGGGIVINNEIYQGSHGMAGELGHIVVETDGVACNCGQKGCVEQYASASGIVNMARRIGREVAGRTGLVQAVKEHPESITSKLVYELVEKGDPVALRVHRRACKMLGRACGIIANSFAPDMIVLGGGVMMAGDIIIKEVSKVAEKHCWPEIWERCSIVRAELGEDAGLLGTAALAFDHFGK